MQGQYCGQCFCHPEQDILICSGMEVVSFPALSLYDMNRLSEIILEETRITTLPMREISEYVSLERFVDKNNAFTLCRDIYTWRAALVNVTFFSSCFDENELTATEIITTSIASEKIFSSGLTTEMKTVQAISESNKVFTPSPLNAQKSTVIKGFEETTEGNYTLTPAPIGTDEENWITNKIIIIFSSLLAVFFVMVSITILIYRGCIKRTTSNRTRLMVLDDNSLFELREYRQGIYNPTTTDSEV